MNIYIHIDQAWSYRFLTKHKKIIADYDFFTFNDRFLTTAINFVMAHVNFKFNKDPVSFNAATSQVSRLIEDYPLLGQFIPAAMYELYHMHIDAFVNVPGVISDYQMFIDDFQTLTGLLFVIDNRSNNNAILHS